MKTNDPLDNCTKTPGFGLSMKKLFKDNIPFTGIAVNDVCPPLIVTARPVDLSSTVTVTGGTPLISMTPFASLTTMLGAGIISEPAVTPEIGNGLRNAKLEATAASG
jgi:hypothetical protein